MAFLTFIEATVKLGIPMIVLSWLIFSWLFGDGELDRKADRKSTGKQVKLMKKSFKKKKDGGAADYMVEKWMWFGSGFYGLAGLWTFAVIEISDVFRVIFNPSRIIDTFNGGFVSAIIAIALNQLSNLVSAFVWFGYWGDDGVIIWVLVAYLGYWIGVEMARRGEVLPIENLWEKLKSKLSSWR